MSITGLNAKWLDNPEKWTVLAQRLRDAKEFGIDTETYGQLDKTSPQHRARVHCWSVGMLSGQVTQYGYRKAVGVVLPHVALYDTEIRKVLADTDIRKWAHNAPHDIHAINNMDVELNGCQDSLQWFRVAVPGLGDYGLKSIEDWALKLPPRPTFIDMVTHEVPVITARGKTEKGCICGAKPCHQRSNKQFLSQWATWEYHTRVQWRHFIPIKKLVEQRYSVTDFTPQTTLDRLIWGGNSWDRWQEWLDYSLSDAVHGIEGVDWLRRKEKKTIKYPW